MSVEAMTMVTISGPEKMVGTAIQSLIINREFHPENAIKLLAGAKELMPFDMSNPYADSLAKTKSIASAIGAELDYRDFTKSELAIEGVSEYVGGLADRLESIKTEREEKALVIKNNEIVSEQLTHFKEFNVELNDLFSMKYLKFHFGRIPSETYKELLRKIDTREDVYFVSSGVSGNWVYGAYLALPSDFTQIDSLFSSLGFERIHIEVKGNVEDTANEVIKRLENEKSEAEKRIEELGAELEAIKKDEVEKLLLSYSWLRYMSDSFDVISYAGRRHGRFYIIGWIPEANSEKFVKECEAISGFACFLTAPREVKNTPPPVKLKTGFLQSVYQPFVEMFGLPATGEMDPRLFFAITYTIIFGIMFGDVGQGLSIAILGFLLWKYKKVWLGRILGLCGLSSTAFGFFYGSVFGDEIMPWGYHVLDNDKTMQILIISVILGVFLLIVCMIMNIMNGIRQRDVKRIFFSPNGVAGIVFYGGLAVGVALKVVMKIDIIKLPYIICVIILPLLAIFAAEPLTKLINGEKDWKPKSVGMFFVEGFFEMFETLLSYVSNTVSFLRIGAYAISHAGMMLVVYMLSGQSNIVGIIFGNILVASLETMLVCIQVMRLEYYEMFGRYYEGGGVKFSPKIINYKVAD